jgi:hypothetical protein
MLLLGFLRFAFMCCESVNLIKGVVKCYVGSFNGHGMSYRKFLAFFRFILVSEIHF